MASAIGSPSRNHWYINGAVPPAWTENVAVAPGATVRSTGCFQHSGNAAARMVTMQELWIVPGRITIFRVARSETHRSARAFFLPEKGIDDAAVSMTIASGMIAVARLTGQALGAALVALCFGLGGAAGPGWALSLGAGFAGVAALASLARLWTV